MTINSLPSEFGPGPSDPQGRRIDTPATQSVEVDGVAQELHQGE